MKILFIHNSYSEVNPSGEEFASKELASILEEHGHSVKWFSRNSDIIKRIPLGRLYSFFSGIHSFSAARKLSGLLNDIQPDIIQVQNIYPLISSSIFKVIKKRNIPVVMRCPNYRLFCPTGLCIDSKGRVCEKCWRTFPYEFNCAIGNCMNDAGKSIGYAFRSFFNRISNRIIDGVDIFIVQSEFQKLKFVSQGIEQNRIAIVPGIIPFEKCSGNKEKIIGEWVGFVGRVSPEKGICEYLAAARQNPSISFKVAGYFEPEMLRDEVIPSNVEFVGFLKGEELNHFFQHSRIIVVPSKWYEGFPNVILKAFMYERPVIASNIGAMQSIIDSGQNGLLVEPGDSVQLSNAITSLFNNPDLCQKYGISGKAKALSSYSREIIYQKLIGAYESAINYRHNQINTL